LAGKGESARLLEIGSGTGEFAEVLCGRYPELRYLGLDLSRVGVEVSSRRVPAARFLQRDLLQPAASTDGLDFGATHAVCSEVLEHLEDPALLLRNAASYMSPGCKVVVTVPGGGMNAFYKHIGHRRHYSAREMSELLENSGFRVEKASDAGFPFFNVLRLILVWRGEEMIKTLSGPPSWSARWAMKVFDVLFRFNLMRWGWQTVVVARYAERK
jgi:SAM-dependent methyltransferase